MEVEEIIDGLREPGGENKIAVTGKLAKEKLEDRDFTALAGLEITGSHGELIEVREKAAHDLSVPKGRAISERRATIGKSRRIMLRVISVFCVAALCLIGAKAQDSSLTVEQIVQKHIESQGGADKINAIQTMKATGMASVMGGQIEAPLTLFLKRPNSMRLELRVQDKSLIQAFDGTTAWLVNPFMGSDDPQKSSDEDTQTIKDDSDFIGGPLMDYKSKGSTVELAGKEEIEGTPVYKIKVTRKSGSVQYLYLDAKTFLTMRSSGRRRQMGQDLDLEVNVGNYKRVDGVMVPFNVDQKNEGNSLMRFAIDNVEMNVPAEDSLFRMPAPVR